MIYLQHLFIAFDELCQFIFMFACIFMFALQNFSQLFSQSCNFIDQTLFCFDLGLEDSIDIIFGTFQQLFLQVPNFFLFLFQHFLITFPLFKEFL